MVPVPFPRPGKVDRREKEVDGQAREPQREHSASMVPAIEGLEKTIENSRHDEKGEQGGHPEQCQRKVEQIAHRVLRILALKKIRVVEPLIRERLPEDGHD